jgi:hypothetical protein
MHFIVLHICILVKNFREYEYFRDNKNFENLVENKYFLENLPKI